MALLFLLSLSYSYPHKKYSYTMRTSFNKEFTLTNPDMYLNQNENIFKWLFKSALNIEIDNKISNQWYYVHFLTNNYSYIQKQINFDSNDEVGKDTFVLFISQSQLKYISNISLVKRIESSEKFIDEYHSIQETNYFIVRTASNYQLINNDELYKIERQNYENLYIVRIDKNNLGEKDYLYKKKKAIDFLSNIPEVKSISKYKKPFLKNALISGFTQKNSYNFNSNTSFNYLKMDRYMNQHGLNGENQIITILDSPIDIYHSMFRDDEVPIEFNKNISNHRKIIYYNFNGTEEDLQKIIEDGEHGTHVSGTAAGKSLCQDDIYGVDDFNGNAPESKILYAGYIDNPYNITSLMNKFNSTISSNSWGSVDYDIESNYFGNDIALKNPHSVFIFAAGNEYEVLEGNFSVCDPGGSKNVLTIGAIDNFYATIYQLSYIGIQGPTLYISPLFDNVDDPWIIGTIGTQPGKTRILAVDTEQGNQCKYIEGDDKITILFGEMKDWINECNYSYKTLLFYGSDDSEDINLIEDGSHVLIASILLHDEEKGIDKASFSSTGPGLFGILKPDVMAPGSRVLSAKSRKNSNSPHGCLDEIEGDLLFMDGTSMATPNIAGAMALVHQYFNSGRWIHTVNLDGATSRALLINSAKHPENSKIPDIWFGHGVVDLSTVLPVENDFGVQITRQGIDDSAHTHSVLENGHVIAKILVNKTISNIKKLQITMSYIDQIMNIDSIIPITRDLDLVVVSPSKKVYSGDHLENGDSQHASTNEKVIINEDELEEGEYIIHIYGGEFADSGLSENKRQDFAVVATGPIKNGYIEFSDSNECPCNKCDPEKPGYCICKGENVGQFCQAEVETIHEKQGNFTVGPLRIKRVRFVSDKKIKEIHAKSNYPGRLKTIWVSEKCHLSLGSYEISGETGNEKQENVTEIDFGGREICIAIFNNNDDVATYQIEISEIFEKKFSYTRFIITMVTPVAVVLIIIIIIVICCIKRKNKCKCCKKKDEFESTTSQNLLVDNNRF